jgi:hypothetical protein
LHRVARVLLAVLGATTHHKETLPPRRQVPLLRLRLLKLPLLLPSRWRNHLVACLSSAVATGLVFGRSSASSLAATRRTRISVCCVAKTWCVAQTKPEAL